MLSTLCLIGGGGVKECKLNVQLLRGGGGLYHARRSPSRRPRALNTVRSRS